jgi:hypothetical protein
MYYSCTVQRTVGTTAVASRYYSCSIYYSYGCTGTYGTLCRGSTCVNNSWGCSSGEILSDFVRPAKLPEPPYSYGVQLYGTAVRVWHTIILLYLARYHTVLAS